VRRRQSPARELGSSSANRCRDPRGHCPISANLREGFFPCTSARRASHTRCGQLASRFEFALDKCLVDDDPGGDVTNSRPAKLPPCVRIGSKLPPHPIPAIRNAVSAQMVRDGELAAEGELTIHGLPARSSSRWEGPTAACERSMGQHSCGRFRYDQDQPSGAKECISDPSPVEDRKYQETKKCLRQPRATTP
jgi:hypothetical protein